ncbi:hypothetical protein GCM10027280_39850 [Micromonospora polyrhachis]|uniref:Uncharacterized protein n=1 Tax=Micromonospora polyrhachis TaxID=1282883 RepID=A0A7W7SS64_9ACTN|nr:hypothetical protein [Micromonospora polyrhachis]MBB4959841.1 hypothetical protein [Micromonospora polyrhachis]
MNTATKLGAFALGLVVVFGGAYGAGQLVGPGAPVEPAHDKDSGGHNAGHDVPATSDPTGGIRPGGLMVSDRGYTLTPATAAAGEFAFRIIGPDGQPVTAFDVEHEKRMHLIVARRDLSGFRHVHPELSPDGTWRVTSPLGKPGSWRAFADFKPTGGEALTLGVDVAVPGAFTPKPLPTPTTTATVDGYTVTLDGTLTPGTTSKLTLNVSRDGDPVTDLQPYLGAYGHLVALRDGDLAYLHVHPDGTPGDGKTQPGPAITFHTEVPSSGTYRLFLDFQHGGVVRTAEFTLTAGPTGETPHPTGVTEETPSSTGPATPAPTGHSHN